MSVLLEQFKMTHLYYDIEAKRWRVDGSGLYTHCPVVHVSERTAKKIIDAAEQAALIQRDFVFGKRRIIEFQYKPNNFPSLLNRKETAVLKASLATKTSRAEEYLKRMGATARRYNTGASRANSFRHLTNKRERV